MFLFFNPATSHICLSECFHTDPRTPLILPVQPGPDLANLSARPTHLFSITPQTNWSVTPLSGPRLHFSSHPSPPKHSFFFTVTFSAPCIHTFTSPFPSQAPWLSSCVPLLLNCLYLSRLNHICFSLTHMDTHTHTPRQQTSKFNKVIVLIGPQHIHGYIPKTHKMSALKMFCSSFLE